MAVISHNLWLPAAQCHFRSSRTSKLLQLVLFKGGGGVPSTGNIHINKAFSEFQTFGEVTILFPHWFRLYLALKLLDFGEYHK